MKSVYQLFASYNLRMNQQIGNAACQLSDATLLKDEGAYFGSILGSLNHIMVADLIWLNRFRHHERPFQSLSDLPKAPSKLDKLLYLELGLWQQARGSLDEVIQRLIDETENSDYAKPLSYSNMKGLPFTKPFGSLLFHFFNHQTHHRGQISTLLSQQGLDLGVTDLLIDIPDCQ